MMIRRGALSKLAVGLVVVAMLGVACASDGDRSPDEAPEAASAAPDEAEAPDPEPEPVRGVSDDNVVKVGGWIAQSGPLAVVASIRNAVHLRFDLANEAGGVNGYTFEYVDIDDQADPSQTVTAVRQLWERDEVFALVHPYGSGGLTAVESYVRDNEVPLLFPFADSRILFGDSVDTPEDAFGFIPQYSDVILLMIDHVMEAEGVETLAVLHTNDPLGEAGLLGSQEAAEELGIEIVEVIGYDGTETNYAPLGRRIAASDADAVLVWSFAGPTQVVEAALESGYDGQLLLHDGYRGGFYMSTLLDLPYELDGRAFTNVWWTPVDDDDPASVEYREAFTAAHPDSDVHLGQSGWAAATLFLEAVEEATAGGEPLNWPAVRSVIEGWEDRSTGGSVGITFADGTRVGAMQGKVRRLEDGAWVDATDWTTYHRYR